MTALSPDTIATLGDALFDALTTRTAIAPLTDSHPELTIEEAYRIQQRMIERRLAAPGERVIGKKIGVTSQAVMDMLDVRQPDFGFLLASMNLPEGEPLPMDRLIAPRAEGEIAFILKEDLQGPGVTAEQVIAATEYVLPCFEIVDSRIRDWKIRIQDTVADNASCGMLVVGAAIADPRRIDLELAGMTVVKNGEIVGTGAGAAALGHPANAVAWLANTMGALGIPLKAGEIILSGALSALVPLAPGDVLAMTIGGIGSVNLVCSGERA
ncbi:MAG: 2-oxopent-4-enoate hydratase [Sphingomonadales bacterium]|nr:2-oxopent-4-enoate hydratase [Sphingomonadales bacterium]